MKIRWLLQLASLLVFIFVATNTYAQSGGTTVRGTVRDPQCNVGSGANVTITDTERNFTRTQLTNDDGAYIFTAIPPGTYKLEVSAQGFKTATASGLVALVDTPTVRDVQLEIGAVSETVDVTSAAEAAINTSDASLGNSFERKRIVELPLNANNVVGLLSLQPGVTRSGFVNGGRADQSNITLGLGWAMFRIDTTNIYAETELEMKAKALATCEVKETKRSRRWKEHKGLMTFLRAL